MLGGTVPGTRSERRLIAIVMMTSAVVVGVVAWLLWRPAPGAHPPISLFLPSLNASLNGATTVCLLLGWRAIRRRQVAQHRAWMLTAVVLSATFLASYLAHHYQVGSVKFLGPAWLRFVYLGVLIPHVLLSAVMVPLVLWTLLRALRRDFAGHRKIARKSLPVWLVVSVTGVLVYWMLYHLSPDLQ